MCEYLWFINSFGLRVASYGLYKFNRLATRNPPTRNSIMLELIHKILLWIHIPFGALSLILFWIPVGVKKGSPVHRKVGWYYYITMWIVVVTAFLLSVCNTMLGKYLAAMYLGYLSIITAYPLWYSYEILRQKKEWTDTYFMMRKVFCMQSWICRR